jgi:dipeptidyl aminopeptidase/acylaminoacyl peptidase
VVHFLGGRPEERAAVYDHADPAARLPHAVPQLLAHGTADDKVPLDLSETYWRLASAAGDPCRFLRLDGVDHFQVIDPSEAAYQQVMAVALDWLAARPA